METVQEAQQQRRYIYQILNQIINNLEYEKTQLIKYQSAIQENWKGEEIKYINDGINTALSEIRAAINIYRHIATKVQSQFYF